MESHGGEIGDNILWNVNFETVLSAKMEHDRASGAFAMNAGFQTVHIKLAVRMNATSASSSGFERQLVGLPHPDMA